MMFRLKIAAVFLAAAAAAGISQPALADGDVICGSGPQSGWESERDLRRRVFQEGWELLRIQVQGDCYEVYARNEMGQAIEAFFHPETLEKLVVFRRGREIFRKDGFDG